MIALVQLPFSVPLSIFLEEMGFFTANFHSNLLRESN